MNTEYCGVSTWYFFISMTRSRATEQSVQYRVQSSSSDTSLNPNLRETRLTVQKVMTSLQYHASLHTPHCTLINNKLTVSCLTINQIDIYVTRQTLTIKGQNQRKLDNYTIAYIYYNFTLLNGCCINQLAEWRLYLFNRIVVCSAYLPTSYLQFVKHMQYILKRKEKIQLYRQVK